MRRSGAAEGGAEGGPARSANLSGGPAEPAVLLHEPRAIDGGDAGACGALAGVAAVLVRTRADEPDAQRLRQCREAARLRPPCIPNLIAVAFAVDRVARVAGPALLAGLPQRREEAGPRRGERAGLQLLSNYLKTPKAH